MVSFFDIIAGASSFVVGLFLHIAWWRLSKPKDDVLGLLVSLVMVPVCIAIAIVWVQHGAIYSMIQFLDEATPAVMIAAMMGGMYVNIYPAVQAASPTMLILLMADGKDHRNTGISKSDIEKALTQEILLLPSIRTLEEEKFAHHDHTDPAYLIPGARGIALVNMWEHIRLVIGLQKGKG